LSAHVAGEPRTAPSSANDGSTGRACRHQTTVTAGTIFEATKLPLTRWFLAMHLLTQAKNNVSALELMCHLGVRYKAAWNRGAQGVITQIKAIEAALPFPRKGFDCDNGSEFLNHHLVNYFSAHPEKPSFTRSRPDKKNDNAHVAQKNWSQVRQLLGYDRFDNSKLVALMNDLYANEWSQMQNHFCPTLKLKEKSREGSRYKKRYHAPVTPYQRVIASEATTEAIRKQLRANHDTLNPFDLKRRIEAKLKRIFSMVTVSSNVRQRI
jgi:hypothetical protein